MTAELAMTNTAGISSIIALWLYVMAGMFKNVDKVIVRLALLVLTVSFVCVTGAIVSRGLEAARFPIANLYESLLLFGWGILAAFLVLDRTYKLGKLGWLAALLTSSVFLYASWLPPGQQEISPLMPALVSNWRAIHVPPLIVSYALFFLAGLVAVVYLWKADRHKTALSCIAAIGISIISTWLGTQKIIPLPSVQIIFWAGSAICLGLIGMSVKSEWNKSLDEGSQAEKYDVISQRCITVAFPLLTFGIITGALWANHAWGAYWSWDPKESMSLVTWLSYATYLHLRARETCRNDVMSAVAVVGLLLTLLTYLGFNFLGFGGLHSYGQIS